MLRLVYSSQASTSVRPYTLTREQPDHSEVHARDQNLPPNITNYLLAILNGGSAVGRVFPNFIADYLGSLNLLIVMGTGSGILAFSVFGANTSAGSVVVAVLYGFFSGGYQSLVGPTLISMATHPSEIGMRLGVGMLFIAINNEKGC